MAAILLPFFYANTASASCYFDGPSGRLSIYCAIQSINGKRIDTRTHSFIDQKLKFEGHTNGLGLPSKINKNTVQPYLSPLLSYSNNINGGNPSKDLILGSKHWLGDKERYSKSGILAGLELGLNGRYIYGDGRYLQYSTNGSYSYNSIHKLGVGSVGASGCDVKNLSEWWYLDICASHYQIRKDLSESKSNNLSIVASNFLKITKNSFSQFKFGFNHYINSDYEQEQAVVGINTIHPNGIYTDLNAKFGKAIDTKLVTRLSLSGRMVAQVVDKPLSLSAYYTESEGGIIAGYDRDERNYGISISYPIWKKISLSLGYQINNSTIDYYDLKTPTVGIVLPAIQF